MFSFFSKKTSFYPGEGGATTQRLPAIRGRFNADRLPAKLQELTGQSANGGLLVTFVPPHADFRRVADGLGRLASSHAIPPRFAALSSTGALCSGDVSTYCGAEAHDREGSFLWLSDELIDKSETFTVNLRMGEGKTVNERVDKIAQELRNVRPGFQINADDTFVLVFCDGLSASEGFLMRALYESKRFPCLAIGGSAGVS